GHEAVPWADFPECSPASPPSPSPHRAPGRRGKQAFLAVNPRGCRCPGRHVPSVPRARMAPGPSWLAGRYIAEGELPQAYGSFPRNLAKVPGRIVGRCGWLEEHRLTVRLINDAHRATEASATDVFLGNAADASVLFVGLKQQSADSRRRHNTD